MCGIIRCAKPGRRTALVWSAAAIVLGGSLPTAARSEPEPTWDGDAGIERFHTTDMFPGIGPRHQPDWGLRTTLHGSVRIPVGSGLQSIEWGKLVAERYDVWKEANCQQWSLGTDLKGAKHRLRLYGERTNDELAFPVAGSDGAIFDRSVMGSDVRLRIWPRWYANVRLEYERQEYVPEFDEYDGHRWTLRTGLERNFGRGRRVALAHEYRRARSVTDLFSFEQNLFRAVANWTLPLKVAAGLEARMQLRNYRTGVIAAPNFGRSDDGGFVGASLGHALAGPTSVQVYGEWRGRMSTRTSKSYDVSTFGVALTASRR